MPQNSSSSLPETISVSIVGWKNKEKATEGLACKESSSLERNSNDSSAQLQSLITTASKNYMEKSASMITSDTNNNTNNNSKECASSEFNKNDDANGGDNGDNPQATAKSFETDQQVFVKRRYFPIAPDNSFVAPSLSQNTTTNNTKATTNSSNLEDVISITVLDEPTPQVRTKKMTSEADGLGNIVLPTGARIVGDKIVFSSGLSLPYRDYLASQQNLKAKGAAASKGGLWGEDEPSFEWRNDGGGWGSNNNAGGGGGWGSKNNTSGGGGGWGSAAATKKAAVPKKKAPVDSSGWGAAIPTTTAPKKAVKSSKPTEFVVENDWEW